MYVWKCWRDTRVLFVVSIAVALIVMPTSVLVLGAGLLTDSGPAAVSSALFLVTSLMAIGLGALGASEQFADKVVQFLYTKPRSRAYFVWVNWAVGCVELLAVALINVFVGWIVLVRYTRNSAPLRLWELVHGRAIIDILIYCLLLYCLTYALTAILRNGLHGLGASIIGVSLLQAAQIVMRVRWQVHVPIPPQPIGVLSPFVSRIVWMLIALSFVFAAQFVAERAEV
jgi:ABC-type transport system involved in multi-copper enzyme maturation permease subunit